MIQADLIEKKIGVILRIKSLKVAPTRKITREEVMTLEITRDEEIILETTRENHLTRGGEMRIPIGTEAGQEEETMTIAEAITNPIGSSKIGIPNKGGTSLSTTLTGETLRTCHPVGKATTETSTINGEAGAEAVMTIGGKTSSRGETTRPEMIVNMAIGLTSEETTEEASEEATVVATETTLEVASEVIEAALEAETEVASEAEIEAALEAETEAVLEEVEADSEVETWKMTVFLSKASTTKKE